MVLKKSIDMTCVDVNAIGENNSNSLSSFCDIQDLLFRSGIKRNFLPRYDQLPSYLQLLHVT
jgi:hypothetical protein